MNNTDTPIRLLLVDDHPLLRHGLSHLFHSCRGISEVRDAASLEACIEVLNHGYSPDLVVLDLSLPDAKGVQAVQAIRALYPKLPILVLTMHDEPAVAKGAIEAGAQGFLTKGADLDTLVFAIKQVVSGNLHFESSVMASIVFNSRQQRHVGHERTTLSHREAEILELISAGLSIQNIAEELGINRKTVSTYKARIMQKLGMTSNADLIRYVTLRENPYPVKAIHP